MDLLNYATRKLLLLAPEFSIPREKNDMSNCDYIRIIECFKHNEMICIENAAQIKELVNDVSITKRFLSTEIKDECDYLPFIVLGIEYLERMGEYENAVKGKKTLHEIINKLKVEIYKKELNKNSKKGE